MNQTGQSVKNIRMACLFYQTFSNRRFYDIFTPELTSEDLNAKQKYHGIEISNPFQSFGSNPDEIKAYIDEERKER